MKNHPINVLAFIPTPTDATSWYRGIGPLAHLKRQYGVNVARAGTVGWPDMIGWDVIFMQRPVSAQQLQVAKLAKDLGRPLWLDYDDDLMNVPIENKAWAYYQAPQTQKTIQHIWALADVITVSTKDLARKIKPFCKNVVVVRNGFDPSILREQDMKPWENQKNIVSWRGTDTHQKDIMSYTPAILKAMDKHKDWGMKFVGYNPYWIAENLPDRYEHVLSSDVLTFFRVLRNVRARINIVPLHYNTFNHAKSNIGWLEAILCGSVSIVPKWEEWELPGAGHYTSLDGFFKCMDYYMSNPKATLKEAKEGHQFARVHFNLDLINQTRWQILNDLVRLYSE